LLLFAVGCAKLLDIDGLDFSSENEPPGGRGGATPMGGVRIAAGVGGIAAVEHNPNGGMTGSGTAAGAEGEIASGTSGQTTGSDEHAGGSNTPAAGSGGQTGCASDAQQPLSCVTAASCAKRPCGGYLWADGTVPFQMDSSLSLPEQTALDNAARAWSQNSDVIAFSRCLDDDCPAQGRARWLEVTLGAAPRLSAPTSVGPQRLELPASVSYERVVHELGHVLGLPDVWRRPDRDRYLRLSEAAFCAGDGHWDATMCEPGSEQARDEPYQRPTGQFGTFETGSAMNLSGPEVCESEEPDPARVVPTARDLSALVELYLTGSGWSPFAPLARDVSAKQPLEHSLAPKVRIVGSPALTSRSLPQLDVYARGSDQQIYWKFRLYSAGRFGSWVDWRALGCCFDSDPTAVSWSFDHTDLFARDIGGEIRWAVLSQQGDSNNLQWGAWRSLGAPDAGAASAPAVASSSTQRLHLFVRGGDDCLYYKAYSGAWSQTWTRLSDETFIGKPTAAARTGGRVDVMVVTTDGHLRHHAFDGSSWLPSELLDGPIAVGSSPALAASAGTLYLYAQTPDHHLAERTSNDRPWGAWRDLGGALDASPAAVGSLLRPHVDIAATSDDHGSESLWLRSWPYRRPCYVGSSTCGECAEECDGACPTYAAPVGDPTAYKRDDQDDVVISGASDGHVYQLTRNANWALEDLMMDASNAALAAGNPAAYTRSDAINSIVYRSIDDNISEVFSDSGGWASGSLTSYGAAPVPGGAPAPYVRSDGQNSVIYRAANGHVYELYLWGSIWASADLSGSLGAPEAAGDPLPFVRADRVNAIVYRDTQNRFNEIFLSGNWQTLGIWQSTDAVGAAGDAAPHVRSDNRNALVYRGLDGHVYELSSNWDSHSWIATELSDAAAAPPAASDPRAYSRSDGLDAVVYQASDQDIYELSRHGSQWTSINLSRAAGSPPAASRPWPYVRSDRVNAVVYRATDARLYELSSYDGEWQRTIIYDPVKAQTTRAIAAGK